MPFLNDKSIDLTNYKDLAVRRNQLFLYMQESNFLTVNKQWYHFDLFKLRQAHQQWSADYSIDKFSIPNKVFSVDAIEELNRGDNDSSFHWFKTYKRHMSQYMLVVRNEGTLDESFEFTIDEKDRRIIISWFNVNQDHDNRIVRMHDVGTGRYPISFKQHEVEFTYLTCLLNYIIFGHYIEING